LAVLYIPIIGDLTILNVLIFIVGLVILWLLVSIPVYLAAKFVTSGEASLSDTMFATLFGSLAYLGALFIMGYALSPLLGAGTYVFALIVAFVAWLGVFKASFKTGWLNAIAIALLAILVFAAIAFLFGALLGVLVPAPFFPRF
jgi:hypothetical protein